MFQIPNKTVYKLCMVIILGLAFMIAKRVIWRLVITVFGTDDGVRGEVDGIPIT